MGPLSDPLPVTLRGELIDGKDSAFRLRDGSTGVSRGLDRDDEGLETGLEHGASSRDIVDDVRAVGYGLWCMSGKDGADMPRTKDLRGRERVSAVCISKKARRG